MNPTSIAPRWDAVVIGSGHNGLVAAAYLAQAGQSVLVLEKNDWLGGATTSQRLFPDYDAWLSRYAYLISLFPSRIVQELDLPFETRRRRVASCTPWTDRQGRAQALLLLNDDVQRSRQSLQLLTGSDRDWLGYQRLLQLEMALAEVVWPSLLEPLASRQQFQQRLQSSDQREAWEAFVERPLGEIFESLIQNDLLRGLLLTDAKIGVLAHAHDPSLLQNRCFIYHVVGGGTGEWQVPVGGMQSLVRSLQDRCRHLGVQFLTGAAAQGISLGRQENDVQFQMGSRSQSVAARHVLVNAGPRTMARLLDQPWAPQPNDEGSVVKVNMLLRRLPKLKADVSPEEAFCGTLHLDEGYGAMQESYRAATAGEVPDPAPCEIYCHTLTDDSILSPELRDAGYHTLTLFGLDMPYRLFADQHDQRRDQVLESYLAGIQRICAEPFLDCLARDRQGRPCLEIKTPQDLEREIDLDLGNIFHNQLSWFFTDDPRQVGQWGVETDFPRVWRAGSSACRGGAVSGIPGRNAALSVLQATAVTT